MLDFPEEFEELLRILEEFNYNAYLIGARALILHGLLHRTPKDIPIMVSVGDVRELRGRITEELRRLQCSVEELGAPGEDPERIRVRCKRPTADLR